MRAVTAGLLLALVLALVATEGSAQETPAPTEIARGMEPAWSPDGRWIVVSVLEDDQRDLFVVKPDGSGRRRITDTPGSELLPTWSSDGRLAYVQPAEDGLRVMTEADPLDRLWEPEGLDLTDLTPAFTAAPWADDGSSLAVVVGEYPALDVHRASVDGGASEALVTGPGYDGSPAWSPDGRLAFVSDRAGSRDVWIREPDGRLRRLTTDSGDEAAPTWSPDGRWIAFVSEESGTRQIHALPASGGRTVRLTDHHERCGYPAWSPDGARLAYTLVTEGRGNDRVMLVSLPGELHPD